MKQREALDGVLDCLRGLNLPGWVEPEVLESKQWPYTVASWHTDGLSLLIEFEWKAETFKYGLHPKDLHGFTYYSPSDLGGAEGARFLAWFKENWVRHLHTTEDE